MVHCNALVPTFPHIIRFHLLVCCGILYECIRLKYNILTFCSVKLHVKLLRAMILKKTFGIPLIRNYILSESRQPSSSRWKGGNKIRIQPLNIRYSHQPWRKLRAGYRGEYLFNVINIYLYETTTGVSLKI